MEDNVVNINTERLHVLGLRVLNQEGHIELAYALVEELGPTPKDTTNDGSRAVLEELAEFYTEHGRSCTAESLRRLRRFATAFPQDMLTPNLPWSLHLEAGNPYMLKKILERTKDKKPTKKLISDTKKIIQAEEKPFKATEISKALVALENATEEIDKREVEFEDETHYNRVMEEITATQNVLSKRKAKIAADYAAATGKPDAMRSHLKVMGD